MRKKGIVIAISLGIVVMATLIFLLFFFTSEKKKVYTVEFYSDDVAIIDSIQVEEGESLTKPEDPTKEGYLFIGWEYNGETYDFSVPIKSDIKLVAKWQEVKKDIKTYTVKFDTSGGSTILNQVVKKGSKVKKPTDPTKKDYEFVGWFVNDEEYDFNKQVTKNLTIVAKWEKKEIQEETESNSSNQSNNSQSNSSNQSNNSQSNNNQSSQTQVKKYTVTFNSNGGSNVSKQTVEQGKKATKPTDPTREGYTFNGWTLNGSTYNFNTTVTSNITLVATWTEKVKKSYTVTFNSNGGSSVSSQTVEEGKKVTQPSNPTREGYSFNGWTLNGSTYSFNNTVAGNMTLVATWTQKTYTISVAMIDLYSPDRVLTVYENGNQISVSEIRYSDGYKLCSGSNLTVNVNDIAGETSFIVVLSGGTQVTATVN